MRPFKSIFFSIFLALSAGHAVAAEGEDFPLGTVAEVVTAVESVYGQAESLRADFVQVTRSAALGEDQQQRGKVVMKRPRMMRWDFSVPDTKLFVTDGKTMWIWSPADNQVIIYEDFGAGGGANMASLLTDLNQIDELFTITIVEGGSDEKNSITLDLAPKQEQRAVKQLRLTLSRKKLLVENVVITDQFDTVTDLTFTQLKLNPKVGDEEFSFQIPAGVEVIRPEGL